MSLTGNMPLHRPACRWTAIFLTSFIPEPVKGKEAAVFEIKKLEKEGKLL